MTPDVDFDSFRTIAEIAIALTGFIGILIVLRADHKAFPRLGVITILGTTLGAVLFAFVPEFLLELMDPEAAWRLATGAFGWYHLALILNHQVRQWRIQANTPVQWVIVLLSLVVVGLKIGVGFGFWLEQAFAIYLLGLWWLVGIAGYLFARVMLDGSGQHDPAGP